jgi:alanine racemase
MNYSAQQITEITNSSLIGDENFFVKTIEFDSRNIFYSANVAFLAINTSKNSGEKYIRSAVEK